MEKASTADMVKDAIKTLGERTGSSLHNIKKYIEAVYKVDMRYRAPRIRKFLRTAVGDGGVVQTRGRGASGSFKLPPKQQPVAATPAKKAASKTISSVRAARAKKTPSRTTTRKASGTTVSTSASRTSARSAASASSVSSASTASSRSTKPGRARRF